MFEAKATSIFRPNYYLGRMKQKILRTCVRPLILGSVLLGLLMASCGENDVRFKREVADFQKEKNELFMDPKRTPLSAAERKVFEGLDFFEADSKFRVKASAERIVGEVVEIPTTTDRIARYRPFVKLKFELNGEQHELTAYANIGFPTNQKKDELEPLFLPFTDLTNGDETYGGGRYIELARQEGTEWVLDFNHAYSPFCAYNESFSCPLPPSENDLNAAIRAGVRYTSEYH